MEVVVEVEEVVASKLEEVVKVVVVNTPVEVVVGEKVVEVMVEEIGRAHV